MSTKHSLPRSIPETQGISSSDILAFLNTIEDKQLELHSFMLLRHGKVLSEGWWHPYSEDKRHMLFSLSKSFTSTAVGFAVQEGLLSVEDAVIDFFPEYVPENASDFLKTMRVKHLLSMSTGHAEDASGRTFGSKDGNWVKGFLEIQVDFEPGTHFVYNTAATYMLSAIVQKLSGQTLLEYLKPRLFDPLGIEDATWESCPRGINTGGFGLSIKTEDIAKFGQLYLQKGLWNGTQIISSSWIEEATSSHISNGNDPLSDWQQGYGYQFWRCRNNAYRGDGAFGQYCIVIPEQDAVIAITSGLGDMQAVLNAVWEKLLPSMSASPQPENPTAQIELQNRLKSLALPVQSGQISNTAAEKISGKCFILEENDIKLQSISFNFDDTHCTYTTRYSDWEESVTCGIGEYVPGIVKFTGSAEPVMAYGYWIDPNSFVIVLQLVETPFCYKLTCCFENDTVELKLAVNVNFGQTEFPVVKGKL